MPHRPLCRSLAAALVWWLALGPARPAAAGDGLEHPRIVNGELSAQHPSVGALLRGNDPDTAFAWCSGTLIGCETFLTAAHCVQGFSPGHFLVFLQHAGFFPVSSIALHPGFDFPNADVAVLKLGQPVAGVAPSRINTTAAPAPGTAGTIVGFGRAGGNAFDYGLKRSGAVTTASCTNVPNGGSDTTLVCWDFTAPLGPPGSNSNTCNADSGGPLFADLGGGPVVAGITSGGQSFSCLPTDHSYDANVFTYRAYIETEGGADLASTACGALPQVGETGTAVYPFTGTLSSSAIQGLHAFEVAEGTALLRVVMNAVDDGLADFDLYVRAGAPPTTTTYDCRRIGSGQFAACDFAAPASGTWYVMVRRFAGAGVYQATATAFGIDCTIPANEGESCDDGNPCTAGDACQGDGSCAGTVVGDGTPCDDGDPCSQPDTCQAGTCGGIAPALGCKVPVLPARGLLQLDDRTPSTRDKLVWKWNKGQATTKAQFGNPTAGTSYALCVYDSIGGGPARVMQHVMPAGANWKALTRGYRYNDKPLAHGGVRSLNLREGLEGKATVRLTGKDVPLGMPALPLAHQGPVTVQLLNGSACWETTFSSSVQNTGARFKAKAD